MGTGLRLLAVISTIVASAACSTTPKTEAKREDLQQAAQASLASMEQVDPSLAGFIAGSKGYAVFPSVGKGAFVVGGSYGRGIVYEHGTLIGYADITSASVGLQAGGQSYDELIVFGTDASLDDFRRGQFSFTANASAVALKSGAAAATPYQNGVAVFVRPEGGLMAEVSVGGQSFHFAPAANVGQ